MSWISSGRAPSKPEMIDLSSSSNTSGSRSGVPSHVRYLDRFFVIILDKGQLRKLDFGHHFTDSCTLRTPDGNETKVSILKVGSKVYFGEGWAEFCTSYRVWIGHLVVFQYCGNSKFDVIMFDMSTTEVDYRTDLRYEDRPSIAVATWMFEVVRQTCSDQRLLGLSPEQNRQRENGAGQPSGVHNVTDDAVPVQSSPLASDRGSRYRQRIDSRSGGRGGVRASLGRGYDPVPRPSKSVVRRYETGESSRPKLVRGSGSVSRLSTAAPKKTKAACSAHAFCTVITNACLAKNGQIWVPSAHSFACLQHFNNNVVKLVYEGSMFAVGLHKTTKGFRLGKGWADFAHACSFRVGDVVELELVEHTAITYRVKIIE